VESAVDVDVCSYDTNMFMSIWSLVFFSGDVFVGLLGHQHTFRLDSTIQRNRYKLTVIWLEGTQFKSNRVYMAS
jgi:hypothetical protein